MLLESEFKQLTHLFYNGEYSSGIQKLSILISCHGENSTLYANRGLFYSQLNDDCQAICDLEHSVLLSPLSYTSYFNLFSIQIRNNQVQQAFNNLCCSLSVLYLLKARISRSFQDVDRAIQYAANNLEARVLKSLILLQSHFYQPAKQEIMAACQIDPKNYILKHIADEIEKKIDPEYVSLRRPVKQTPTVKKRLQSQMIITLDGEEEQEINAKVEQFNALYNQLNQNYGGVTQKIPKENSFSNNIDTFMLQKSRLAKESNKSVIAALEDDDFFADESNFFENKAKISEVLAIAEIDRSETESDVKIFPSVQTNHIDIIEQHSSKDQISSDSVPDEHMQSSNIYPLINKQTRLRVNVINFCFRQAESNSKLDQLYCILSYNKQKMSTPSVACISGSCAWNKSFPEIQITQSPSPLKIKLYNKQRNSIRDQFIADFQVVINTADLLQLPLYDRSDQPVGDLLVHLQMVV